VAAGLFMALRAAHAENNTTGTIIISAVGFESQKGHAVVALYDSGDDWLDMNKAVRKEIVEIKGDRINVTLRNVPHGVYAATVLHDANANGKMDMRWLPYPKPQEGAGISNNWTSTGKPDYDKAKFQFDRSLMSVRIQLVY
jgi:uncharacterized protein (DUF2141 family)